MGLLIIGFIGLHDGGNVGKTEIHTWSWFCSYHLHHAHSRTNDWPTPDVHVHVQCSYPFQFILWEIGSIFLWFGKVVEAWDLFLPSRQISAKYGRKWIITQETLERSISDKWQNEIPSSTSPNWRIVWYKHEARKEATTFLRSVVHKLVALNEWHGRISTKIDKSCPHYGSPVIESVEHIFLSCPFWLNKCGVMLLTSFGNSLLKKKKVILAFGNVFQWCNASLINLLAYH